MHRIRQANAAVGEELHAVQRYRERALVVDDAAPDEKAVAPHERPGVDRPADAWLHDVGMADHRERLGALSRQHGDADVTVVIGCLEAQAAGQVDSGIQTVVGLFSARMLGRRGIEVDDARHGDEPPDLFDDLFPMGIDECVGFLQDRNVGDVCGHGVGLLGS